MQSASKLTLGQEFWCIKWGTNASRLFSTLGEVRRFHLKQWHVPLSTGNPLIDDLLPGDTTPELYRSIEEEGYFHD